MRRPSRPSGSSSTSDLSIVQQGQIPHSRPTLGEGEVRAVSEVIRSGCIAGGEMVERFEQALAHDTGTRGAVACGSGTAALHLTLLAMGIGANDEVVLPSYVCTALLNAIRYVGALPVLAEIDPETCNIDPQDVKARLTCRTKAIIVPHLLGLPADLNPLVALGVPVIEDCAQSVGATYRGKRVGSFGYAAVYSFYATKVITTGEGGMVLSDSEGLLSRLRDWREYDQKDDPAVRYNYKMTDIQAAMGLAQLKGIGDFIRKRRSIAQRYDEAFEAFSVQLPPRDPGHIYYRYAMGGRDDAEPKMRALSQRGIHCARPVYRPLHRYIEKGGYPVTEEVWERSLSIPIYPSLTEEEVDRVIESVSDVLGEADDLP